MRKKCLAQEHNTMTRPGLESGPFNPESSALTTRPPRLPADYQRGVIKIDVTHTRASRNGFFGILNFVFLGLQRKTNREENNI